jgi:hypothetical protein
MSYCRWSSNDYQCDIYCYESVGDFFAIHVAGNRIVFCEPLPPPVEFKQGDFDAWLARDRAVMDIIERSERVAIGLPHDGESFDEPDAEAAANRLEYLKNLGYSVPQFAIDALREEAATPSEAGQLPTEA